MYPRKVALGLLGPVPEPFRAYYRLQAIIEDLAHVPRCTLARWLRESRHLGCQQPHQPSILSAINTENMLLCGGAGKLMMPFCSIIGNFMQRSHPSTRLSDCSSPLPRTDRLTTVPSSLVLAVEGNTAAPVHQCSPSAAHHCTSESASTCPGSFKLTICYTPHEHA